MVLGLYRTIDVARRQLADQQMRVRSEIADLDAKIAAATSSEQKEVLRAEREQRKRQMPDLWAVDWKMLLLAAAFYLLGLLPPAIYFHQTLVHMKQQPRAIDSISGHVLGHVGKYVPGKAMVVVLRVAAVAGPQVRPAVATVAVFIETLVMMAVGGTIAGILMLGLKMPDWIRLLAVGLAVCASLPTVPPLFQMVVDRIARMKLGADKGLEQVKITWGLMLRGWCWSLLNWSLIGASFTCLLAAAPGTLADQLSVQDYLTATAAISLAMVAGFVSLLPGGAGVRELVITTVLAMRFGMVPALVAAILARLVFLIVELMIGGLLWFGKRKKTENFKSDDESQSS